MMIHNKKLFIPTEEMLDTLLKISNASDERKTAIIKEWRENNGIIEVHEKLEEK